MIALDTNVLVRYLAQDDPVQSPKATRLIEEELSAASPGYLSLVALLETVWVMESCYAADTATIESTLMVLLDSASLELQSGAAVRAALGSYGQGGVDLHDCLIQALGAARGAETVTFDQKAAKRLAMRLL